MVLKPQEIINKKINMLNAFFVYLFVQIVYLITQANSLSFWDAGEYITCSSILGVPHPPGNPFYIILGRFFSIIGLNLPHAFVINFLSGLFSALAAMLIYLITVKLVTMFEKKASYAYIAGFIAATYTAFSYTYWTNAIEAEVYSGLAFVINIIIWLTFLWVEKSEDFSHQNILLLIIYIFFLGFGIHQTSLQIAPAILFITVYPMLRKNYKTSGFWTRFGIYVGLILFIYILFNGIGKAVRVPDLAKIGIAITFFILLYLHMHKLISKRVWWFALVLIGLGLSTHIFLYVRASIRPFINEGYPHNLQLFTNYILRRQYGSSTFMVRNSSVYNQFVHHFLRYFSMQFFNVETIAGWFKSPLFIIDFFAKLLVTIMGFSGAYYQFRKNKHSFIYFFSLFFMTSIGMVFVMNMTDKEVRDRDYFFTTAYYLWTVWMAIGSIGLVAMMKEKSKILATICLIVVLVLPVINLASQYHIHDRSREFVALDYGTNLLNSVEENAILFTNGDNDTFPLWYAQAVYDPNAIEYIPESKASTNDEFIIHAARDVVPTEKTKKLIKKGMDFKNEQCFGIRKDVTIANLSLLNTDWYIRQLRDHEGVEFNIPDDQITPEVPRTRLYPRMLPKDMKFAVKGVTPEQSFSISLKEDKVLYTKDLAVLQIIRDNYGKRPIYFAVTVSDVTGFGDHLRNEGMVDRLVPERNKDNRDMDRLIENIDTVYKYRGIFDDTIYKDHNMKRLINNYGAAYMRVSQFFMDDNNLDKAAEYMEKAISFIDDKERFYPGLVQLFMQNNELDKAYSFLTKALKGNPRDLKLNIQAGYLLIDMDKIDEAFRMYENAARIQPSNDEVIQIIYQSVVKTNEIDKGIELLEKIKKFSQVNDIDSYIKRLNKIKDIG